MVRDAATKAEPQARARGARRQLLYARRVSVWTMRIAFILLATAAVALTMMAGQRLHAPDWLVLQLEEKIEQNLNGLQIEFGEVQFVMSRGWRPSLRLVDVKLSDPHGQPIVELADARASLALPPLLQGQVRPGQIELSGAFATLRRDADGKVVLSFGDRFAPAGQAVGVTQLIEAWDERMTTPQLASLTSVTLDSLTLRYEDARQDRAWTLDGGSVRLDRDGDDLRVSAGFSLLSGRDYASSIEMNYASRIGETEAHIGVSVQDIPAEDIAGQTVALAWLKVLRAPISGALRASVDANGRLGPLSATLQIGAGVLQPNDRTLPIPFDGARSYLTYDPVEQVLDFNELSASSSWGSGTAEGRAYINIAKNGVLTDMISQFTLSALRINPPEQYAEPLMLDKARLDFRLSLDPFRLILGQMSIEDGDKTIRLSGDLSAAQDGWRLALDAQADSMTSERLMQLWPRRLAPNPRIWATANLNTARIQDIDFALRLSPGGKPDLYADFDFSDTSIRFLKSMPLITGANGHAMLSGKRFSVVATGGSVAADEGGAVDVTGTTFIIPDTSIRRAAPGVVRLSGQGPVTAVMSLLNRPPLQVLKGTPLPVDLASGTVRATGTLALPLKKGAQFDEMEFFVEGQVENASSTVLVPGHVAAAPSLDVSVDNGQVVLSGDVRIGDVPAQVRWRQPLGAGVGKSSRVSGEIELSPLLVRTFGIGLPPGSVTGQGSGTFSLDIVPGEPLRMALKSDLKGVGLRLPELGWSKPQSATGLLELDGVLGPKTRIDRLVVQAAGLSATGTVLNREGGGLERAVLSSVRIGGWLDAAVELVGRGARSPDVRVLDGRLDLRRATFGSGGGSGSSGPLNVQLSRLQVTDTIALTGFNGRFSTRGGLSGPFTGALNGSIQMAGTVVPKAGRSAVQVKSTDAGAVFRAAGIFTYGRGGDFVLTLVPVGDAGQFDGNVRITNTRIKDAPAMAAMLNAVSVVGLLDEMAGQGILFSEVEGRFRLGPSRLTLYESSAVGPSIGLSMDGIYDIGSGQLGMRGVISPVYLLNSIGSVLTRKGEGLIGFSYRLTGAAQAPNVEVNPLSGLAPGMLREVFRGAPPAAPGDAARPSKPSRSGVTGGGDR